MAKGTSGSRVPARNGGNRVNPPQKIGLGGVLPRGYKNTYGAGDGQGGGSTAAGGGGNRVDPAQKVGLGGVVPPGYDGYFRPLK